MFVNVSPICCLQVVRLDSGGGNVDIHAQKLYISSQKNALTTVNGLFHLYMWVHFGLLAVYGVISLPLLLTEADTWCELPSVHFNIKQKRF